MAENEQEVKNIIIHPEPTTREGFRLRAIEMAAELAEKRTQTSGIQFTTDDILRSARKIMSFIESGF